MTLAERIEEMTRSVLASDARVRSCQAALRCPLCRSVACLGTRATCSERWR